MPELGYAQSEFTEWRIIGETSRFRLGTHYHVGAHLLSVLELVLLQPVTCDLCQSFVPKLVPALL